VTGAAPVRWGFLGAGSIARTALGPAVAAAPNAVLHAAAARDPARAAALGPVRSYGDYAELLADDDVEAVYVALHNDAHLPWTLAALEAGKHVLCEKPLGLDAGEVDRMAAAAGDRLVVEASWYRWHPRVRLAQARLPELGAVQHVAAGFTSANELEGYRLDPAHGGGALYDVGCYAVSACLWAVGQGRPADVVASVERGESGVDLDSRAILRWDTGVEAEVHASLSRDLGQWLVITGERGELELRGEAFTAWKAASELWVSDGTGTERVPVPAADAYAVMVEEVSSVLRGGPGWVLPLAESRSTAAVLDAAFASADAAGAPVAVRGPE
jgi:predicted dehydrogenase